MAFTKFTRIILYVIAVISLLVVLFFYVSPKTVDYNALETKVDEIMNPVDVAPAPLPVVDTLAQDSTAVADSTATGAMETIDAAGPLATVETLDNQKISLKEQLSGWERLVWHRVDIVLVWAYILMLITLLAAIVFPLLSVLTNTKALIRLAVVLAGAAVLVVISWLLSSDTPIEIIGYTGTSNTDPSTLRMIDTVLFVTYMLFGLTIASILYSIISRAFK
jgi:hypothetical protein